MKLTRIIGVLCLTFIAAVTAFPQQTSIVTPAFKNEWRSIAGTTKIDTTEYDRVSLISNGSERKAYTLSLSPEAQLNVFRLHWAYALANFKYSPEEEALVREGIKFLTLANFINHDKVYDAYHEWSMRVMVTFEKAGDSQLYRYTFEIPGDIEVVSMCPLKPAPTRTIKAAYKPMTLYCNCNWTMGCDDGAYCGTPQGGCRAAQACGILGWEQCNYRCGGLYTP